MSTNVQGFNHLLVVLHHFVMAKLATNSIRVNPYAVSGKFDHYKMMQKNGKMTETIAHGYSYERYIDISVTGFR